MPQHQPSARSQLARAERHARKGRIADALQAYRAVLTRYPGNRRAHEGVQALTGKAAAPALGHYRSGRYREALEAAAAPLATDPDNLALLEVVAASHRHLGKPQRALPVYERLIELSDRAAFVIAKGAALQEAGQPGAAVPLLEAALARSPQDRKGGLTLARCRLAMGHPRRALAAVDTVLAGDPEDAGALALQGEILLTLGDLPQARAALAASLRNTTGDAAPLATLAQLARATGDRAEAARLLRQALTLQPQAPALHRNLSMVQNYHADDPHIAQMRALLPKVAGEDGRSQLHFALFNAFDRLEDHATAITHLDQANAARRRFLRYDPARDAALLPWLRNMSAPPGPTAPKGAPTPIFVTGLPRSGTTLTETLLARHTGATPAGELPVVNARLAPLLRRLQAESRSTLGEEETAELAAQLRDDLAQNAGGSAAVIDKMPLNFRYVHLVARLLPDARFIHLSRQPMANGWSLLRHCFGSLGNGFAYDAEDIARFMALERAHMEAIAPQLGSRLLRLRYEDLVQEPRTWAHRMAEHCGLPDAPAHDPAARAILTASTEQVRQPVSRHRNTGWKPYAPWLQPLAKALENTGLGAS